MKINTNEMHRIASEINALAVDYQALISDMYSRFSNMPSETHEWTGNQAKKFVGYVLLDKSDLMSVGDKIKGFSKIIKDDATLVEGRVSKIWKDESNG